MNMRRRYTKATQIILSLGVQTEQKSNVTNTNTEYALYMFLKMDNFLTLTNILFLNSKTPTKPVIPYKCYSHDFKVYVFPMLKETLI